MLAVPLMERDDKNTSGFMGASECALFLWCVLFSYSPVDYLSHLKPALSLKCVRNIIQYEL